jgi:ribose/xylose/arabinose/galactoside ABC-type transport system permease subunit
VSATTPSTTTAETPAGRRRLNIELGSLRAYGLVIAIILLSIFFWSQRPAYLSPDNLFGLLRSMAALSIMAIAQLLVIVSGELDLSVGSIYGLAATTLAVLWLGPAPGFESQGFSFPIALPLLVALVLALSVGVFAGAINAFFTTVVKIPSFIATLGMLSIASGVEFYIGNVSNFNPAYNYPPPDPGELSLFRAIGATKLPFEDLPIPVLWMAIFAVIFWVLLHRSLFGFRLLAIGGNPAAAQIARLPVRKYKFVVFMLCSLMAAVAGILDFSYIGSVGPNSGAAFTFPVFAAVVIGGASLSGGKGTVVGAILGAALLAVLRNGMAIMGVGAFLGLIFVGVVTIGAVTLDRLAQRK